MRKFLYAKLLDVIMLGCNFLLKMIVQYVEIFYTDFNVFMLPGGSGVLSEGVRFCGKGLEKVVKLFFVQCFSIIFAKTCMPYCERHGGCLRSLSVSFVFIG